MTVDKYSKCTKINNVTIPMFVTNREPAISYVKNTYISVSILTFHCNYI